MRYRGLLNKPPSRESESDTSSRDLCKLFGQDKMRVERIKLKSGQQLAPGDFNVIIGGNAVGKTTLLLELYAEISQTRRTRSYWIESVQHDSQDLRRDIGLVFHSLVRRWDGANLFYYSQASKNPDGNVDLEGNLRFSPSEWQDLKRLAEDDQPLPEKNFFADIKFRRPFVSLLNCETRLNVPNQANVVPLDQPAQDPLNVLYRNRKLLKDVSSSIQEQFSLQLALLTHRMAAIELGLAESSVPPFDSGAEDLQLEYEKVEQWKGTHFFPVQDIGHGIRSMVRLLASLLEPVNQVVLIDEPEMHLYPSQKRWLGRQLVKLAKEQHKQAFIVTHDPIVLQGILDTPSSTTLFRVDFDSDGRTRFVKPCTLEHLSDVGARRNQDSYLQGLFYQRCIVVEGASDRAFYQAVVEEYPGIADKDLGFVASGGKGSTKNVAYIASRVGLRCAFIYDFDALVSDLGVVEDVFSLVGGDTTKLHELRGLLDQFGPPEYAKKSPEVKALGKAGLGSDFAMRHREVFENAVKDLSSAGIFIVPTGGLESWAPEVEPKYRFPEIAPDVIRADSVLKNRLDEFIRPVLVFLGC